MTRNAAKISAVSRKNLLKSLYLNRNPARVVLSLILFRLIMAEVFHVAYSKGYGSGH